MKTGVYQRKLYLYFSCIAGVFIILVSIAIFSITLITERSKNNSFLQQSIAHSADVLDLSTSIINNALEDIKQDPALYAWAENEDKSSYYYYALRIRDSIINASTNLEQVDFDVAITKKTDDSFVITQTGTQSKIRYFSRDTSLKPQEWGEAIAQPTKEPLFFAHYDDDNRLSSLFMVLQDFGRNDDVYAIVYISLDSLLSVTEDTPYFISCGDQQFPYMNTTSAHDFVKEECQSLSDLGPAQLASNTLYQHGNANIGVLTSSFFPISIVLSYGLWTYTNLGTLILVNLLIIITFAALCIVFFTMISRHLYTPIDRVLQNYKAALPDSHDPLLDEFAFINQKTAAALELSLQLSESIHKHSSLAKISYYRDLLFGIPDSDCPLSASEMQSPYCVALIEFSVADESVAQNELLFCLQKENLILQFQQDESEIPSYFINASYNSIAIIFASDLVEPLIARLEALYAVEDVTLSFLISLSDVVGDVTKLCNAYEQAQELLDFRYVSSPGKVICANTTTIAIAEDYYYPLSQESTLIRAIATGNSDLPDIYQKIITRNHNGVFLSIETRRNFVYALIGTILRAFQELKTTPEETLGCSLQIDELYAQWNNPEIFSTIESIFIEIQASLAVPKDNSLQQLFRKMQEFIATHYTENIMLTDMAEYCHVSPCYCSAVFKKVAHDNYKNYLNMYRIQRACELINQNNNIKTLELSQAVGFNSSNSFIRVFEKHIGCAPKAYAARLASTNATGDSLHIL